MAAPPKTPICTEDSKNNGCIGTKKPGTVSFQWQPTTRTGMDQFKERNLENTLASTRKISYKSAITNSPLPSKSNSSKSTQNGSVAAQGNIRYSSNSKTTMQHDKVAPITLTDSDSGRNLQPIGAGVGTAAIHIGKLTKKMQTTTILTKSEKMRDEGDKIWLPQMDQIDIVLPNQSSSSAEMSKTDHKVKLPDEMLKTEEYINFVLYGPRKTKRLPIFEEICPSSLFSNTENPL